MPYMNTVKNGNSNCKHQQNQNHNLFKEKPRTTDLAMHTWHSEVSDSSACLNYRMMKNDSKFEDYLTNLESKHPITLCKIIFNF